MQGQRLQLCHLRSFLTRLKSFETHDGNKPTTAHTQNTQVRYVEYEPKATVAVVRFENAAAATAAIEAFEVGIL